MDESISEQNRGSASASDNQAKAILNRLRTALTTYCVAGTYDPAYDAERLSLYQEVETAYNALAAADIALADAMLSMNLNLIQEAIQRYDARYLDYLKASNNLRRAVREHEVPTVNKRGRFYMVAARPFGTKVAWMPVKDVEIFVVGPGYTDQGKTNSGGIVNLGQMLPDGDGQYLIRVRYKGTTIPQATHIADTSKDVKVRAWISADLKSLLGVKIERPGAYSPPD